jgi:hypothetical protein
MVEEIFKEFLIILLNKFYVLKINITAKLQFLKDNNCLNKVLDYYMQLEEQVLINLYLQILLTLEIKIRINM